MPVRPSITAPQTAARCAQAQTAARCAQALVSGKQPLANHQTEFGAIRAGGSDLHVRRCSAEQAAPEGGRASCWHQAHSHRLLSVAAGAHNSLLHLGWAGTRLKREGRLRYCTAVRGWLTAAAPASHDRHTAQPLCLPPWAGADREHRLAKGCGHSRDQPRVQLSCGCPTWAAQGASRLPARWTSRHQVEACAQLGRHQQGQDGNNCGIGGGSSRWRRGGGWLACGDALQLAGQGAARPPVPPGAAVALGALG